MRRKQHLASPKSGEHNIFREMAGARVNFVFDFILSLMSALSSYPSSIVEVFMRKSFGSRYFTLATNLTVFAILIFISFKISNQAGFKYAVSLFLFALAYLGMAIKHRLEIKKYGTAYNFERFSKSNGLMHPRLLGLIDKEFYGIKINKYIVSVYLEPVVPFLIGAVLSLSFYTLTVGIILMISGFLFGFRNFVKAHTARQWLLDQIDEQICARHDRGVLMDERPPQETAGLDFPITLPPQMELRKHLVNSMNPDYNPRDLWEDDDETSELKQA